MPYINVDGKLQFVTQEQYDIYTIGQTVGGKTAAAGGNVVTVYNDSGSQKILYPNTVNTSPNQTLPQTYQPETTSTTTSSPFTSAPANNTVKVYGDSTSTTITPTSSGITDQVKVYGDSTSTTITPTTSTLPSEVSSGFYDNTPVDATQTLPPGETTVSDSSIVNSAGQVDPASSLSPGEEIVPAGEIDTAPADQPIDDESSWGVVTPEQAADAREVNEKPDPMAIDDESSWGVVTKEQQASADEINGTEQVSAQNDWQAEVARTQAESGSTAQVTSGNPNNEDASQAAAFRDKARQQQTIASQRKQINNGDWRVRLRLAPQSKYLYNAPSPGILQPLTVTDGVIFPYTPAITTGYKANYSSYELTHSNYKGYFYSGSAVDAVNLTATFTAQDSNEANYLLAVIHFFRSATKMFYGQDAERGSPPPLVFLTGLGEYQFNEHPCLIQSFSYNLPADVNYIRAGSISNTGTNLTTRRDRQSVATNGVFGSLNRLAAAFLTKGAIPNTPSPATLGINRPTYVPTKIEVQLVLLPVQSRQQVSKQFSVKEFANGNLLRGGFW